MKKLLQLLLIFSLYTTFSTAAMAATGNNTVAWSISVLDGILASTPAGQNVATVGDMQIQVGALKTWRDNLAGGHPELAFGNSVGIWPGGTVYYALSNNVTTVEQTAFLDAVAEWAIFANVRAVLRTTQANYVLVADDPTLGGGLATVGMAGGQQILLVGPTAWNRPTLCHEFGHSLGLVHEHQRSDRDSYINVFTNNIAAGESGNFVLLPTSTNHGAYDFLSIMHYSRNAFSVSPNLDTMEPLPANSYYLNLMGQLFQPVLSASDRAGVASVYGASPIVYTNIVTNTLDSGPGSLRAAMYYGLDHPGTTIKFNIPTNDPGYANGVFTIQPTDTLPGIGNSTILDGTTEPGNTNPNGPSIQLSGASANVPGTFPAGLIVRGTNSVVRGLAINGFPYYGILVETGANSNAIQGNYVGLSANGASSITNGFGGVGFFTGACSNLLGGTNASMRNVISGNAYQGVIIANSNTTANVVEGNYIGLNAAGTESVSNEWAGVDIYNGATDNIIGGSAPGAGNVVSGNGEQGIVIQDTNSTGNIVEGNFIGLIGAGTAALPNGWCGVNIFGGASSNTIGGIVAGSGNIISGNGNQGVVISGPGTQGNVIAGNYIGLSPAGTAALPNGWSGVELFDATVGNTIGGTVTGARNIISGNANDGYRVSGAGSSNNVVEGNYIGVDVTGSVAVGNDWAGVRVFGSATSNLVGGSVAPARNVLSGNGIEGLVIEDSGTETNAVAGNYIGVNAAGTAAVPNASSGIDMYNGASGNLIGGGAGSRNIISGNAGYGLTLSESGTSSNLVLGNTFGLNATETAAIPNQYWGLAVYDEASSNEIGGITPGAANIIASNLDGGIYLGDAGSTNNTVRGNSFYGNNGTGIYVSSPANNSASAPSLSSATLTTNLTVNGSLNSTASTSFAVDFYANQSGSDVESKYYIGTKNVTTSAGGSATFSAVLTAVVPLGYAVTATATDPFGNTSGTSSYVTVAGTDSVGDGITDAWRKLYFGGLGNTTNSSSCATCDPDHDGFDNTQEFLAGTNPTNASSALSVTATATAGGVTISFQSVAGADYQVDYRNDIATNGWSVLVDQIPGTGGIIQVTDPSRTIVSKGFYRVDVLP